MNDRDELFIDILAINILHNFQQLS